VAIVVTVIRVVVFLVVVLNLPVTDEVQSHNHRPSDGPQMFNIDSHTAMDIIHSMLNVERVWLNASTAKMWAPLRISSMLSLAFIVSAP
jgi:hypothetical protein